MKSPSPQALEIYYKLAAFGPKNAKQIGREMKIFPNAVYRTINQLMAAGFVEEVSGYPVKFKAKKPLDSMELFVGQVRENFMKAFNLRALPNSRQLLQLEFVNGRPALLKMTGRDAQKSKFEMSYITSGLEVPAETILQNKRAVERGVRVRIICQNLKEVTGEKIASWKNAGVEVKYYPNMEARIFIFDRQTVYFSSYNEKNYQEASGIRFDYAPFAELMQELFEKRWQTAKDLTKF